MRSWAIFLTSLSFVLPGYGQEFMRPFPPIDPVRIETNHTLFFDETVVTEPAEPSPESYLAAPDALPQDKLEDEEPPLLHGDSCDCADCGRLRNRSAWNPYRRFTHWYQNRFQPFMVDTHWGYPQFFCERPFGLYNNMAVHAHINQAAIDQLVLYHYDFEEHSARLRLRGHKQLENLAEKAEWLGQPLIIQETADRQLDERRKAEVVNRLVEMGVSQDVAGNRVHIGVPTTFGLARGAGLGMHSEPELIWQNQLRNSQQQGRAPLGRGETTR